ncbi:hypothetical protein LI328DRAFT_159787 [Trichoderma asperelloides]|nr:hypothetical protein LI328DRAFT_159787 [Trichoderma asperelloides]
MAGLIVVPAALFCLYYSSAALMKFRSKRTLARIAEGGSQASRTRNAGNCHEYNLALLWLIRDATSNASYTVPCLRCTWAWFARASCWLVAQRHRVAPAQYGRSDHGAPHAAPATTRGLLLVYLRICTV